MSRKIYENYMAKRFKDRGYRCEVVSKKIEGLEYINPEVKWYEENLNLEDTIKTHSVNDKAKFPTVFHRQTEGDIMVTMLFDDWIQLYDSYYDDMKLKEYEENGKDL